jgi:hypothetical protein
VAISARFETAEQARPDRFSRAGSDRQALWLLLSGKLARRRKDGMMLGLAIVGGSVAARGKPLLGGVPLGIAALYALRRSCSCSRVAPMPRLTNRKRCEARALLGVSMTATADDIRRPPPSHCKNSPGCGRNASFGRKLTMPGHIAQHLSDAGIEPNSQTWRSPTEQKPTGLR